MGRRSDRGALPAAPGHREPFAQGLIAGLLLVLGVALGLGSLMVPFIQGLDLSDLWSPGSLVRILVVGLIVGIIFGIVFVTPTRSTGRKPEDPVGAFNGGVEWFLVGDYERAAEAFGAVCEDHAAPEALRMCAGYARALADRRRGLEPTIPSAFAHRVDEMVVQYGLYTAAGLFAEQGIPVTEPDGNSLVARVEQREAPSFYEVSYQDAMGTVLTVVKRIDEDGTGVHLEMEPDPNPQPRDPLVLDVAKQAGSGSHDPVRIPTEWASPVPLLDERPVAEDVCTIGLTLRAGNDLDENHALTRKIFSRVAAEYPHVSRTEPLIIMSKVDPHFGIRFYPKREMTHRAEELEGALVRLFKEAGVRVTHHGIADGTVGE